MARGYGTCPSQEGRAALCNQLFVSLQRGWGVAVPEGLPDRLVRDVNCSSPQSYRCDVELCDVLCVVALLEKLFESCLDFGFA